MIDVELLVSIQILKIDFVHLLHLLGLLAQYYTRVYWVPCGRKKATQLVTLPFPMLSPTTEDPVFEGLGQKSHSM